MNEMLEISFTVVISLLTSGTLIWVFNFFRDKKRRVLEERKLNIEIEKIREEKDQIKIETRQAAEDYWKEVSHDLRTTVKEIELDLAKEKQDNNECKKKLEELLAWKESLNGNNPNHGITS